MATDIYASYQNPPQSSARRGFSLSPNNDSDLASIVRGIHVGGAGNIGVTFADDTASLILYGCAACTLYPYSIKRLHTIGTTATSLVGVL